MTASSKAGSGHELGHRRLHRDRLSRPIEEVLPAIAANGFRTIEVATARPHIDLRDTARFARVLKQADRLGLKVRSLHAPFGQAI